MSGVAAQVCSILSSSIFYGITAPLGLGTSPLGLGTSPLELGAAPLELGTALLGLGTAPLGLRTTLIGLVLWLRSGSALVPSSSLLL